MPAVLTIRRAVVVVVLALLVVVLLTRGEPRNDAVAASSTPIYGVCKGAKQGPIKGDVTAKGHEGAIGITALTDGLVSPRDPASGQATGRRQHKPLTFITDVSGATPQLIEALATNENLTSCSFTFYKLTTKGVAQNYFKIVLTNAVVTSYDLTGRPGGNDSATFALTYQKIQWTYVPGGITAEDDWETPSD